MGLLTGYSLATEFAFLSKGFFPNLRLLQGTAAYFEGSCLGHFWCFLHLKEGGAIGAKDAPGRLVRLVQNFA